MQHKKITILQHDNEMNVPPTTLLHQHTNENFLLSLSNRKFPFLKFLRTDMKIQFLEMRASSFFSCCGTGFSLSSWELNLSLRKEDWAAWSHRCPEHLAKEDSHWCQHTPSQNLSGKVVAAGSPSAAPSLPLLITWGDRFVLGGHTTNLTWAS